MDLTRLPDVDEGKASAMIMFTDETRANFDEMYWADDNMYWADDDAAVPVLLIDEATEAITAALHRVRCPLHVERSTDRWDSVRAMTTSAQLATDGLRQDSAATRPSNGRETIPIQRT